MRKRDTIKKMHKGNIKILLRSLALAVFLLSVFIIYYVSNIAYVGKIEIEVPSEMNSNISVHASSPINNQLSFNNNENKIEYKYKRPYKNIRIELKDSAVRVSGIIKFDNRHEAFQLNSNNTSYTFDKNKSRLSFLQKTWHFVKHFYKIILLGITLLSMVLLVILSLKHKKQVLKFGKTVQSYIERKPLEISLCIALILIIFSLITGQINFTNYVETGHIPDQIEYQTCAVNYNNGYGFLTGGNVDDNIDYKIIFSDQEAKYQFELLKGIKRLDRFPAYPYLVSLVYKVFGNNPCIIKYLHWLLLIIVVVLIPIVTINVWGKNTFFG
ncbi:MAG: hypothetical protein ACP5DZ_02950, partial [Bacteroidales bacterium]